MKAILNGRMYNTDEAILIYSKDVFDADGNDIGSNDLMITKSGHFFEAKTSNDQNYRPETPITSMTKKDAIEFIHGQLLSDGDETIINKYLFSEKLEELQ
ncbi:MAG: hypothetical protein V3R78_12550 [Thermodesulfobacteriota bacterium]